MGRGGLFSDFGGGFGGGFGSGFGAGFGAGFGGDEFSDFGRMGGTS